MIKYEIDGFLICDPCKKCSPGYVSSHECNNHRSYLNFIKPTCKKCAEDQFSVHDRCLSCEKKCHLKINEVEVLECKANQNRKCKCKKEFYRDIGSHQCTSRCTKCPSHKPGKRVPAGECLDIDPNIVSLNYFSLVNFLVT